MGYFSKQLLSITIEFGWDIHGSQRMNPFDTEVW